MDKNKNQVWMVSLILWYLPSIDQLTLKPTRPCGLQSVNGPCDDQGQHVFYTPASTKLKGGYTGFTSSVCPSVCGQNHVCSVSSTILAGSISYLHILSNNFKRCVACKGYCKIPKFEFWLCLVMTWDLIWINSMGNHGTAGVFSECRHSSCSSFCVN